MEFLECWRRLPNKGFFLVLLGAWLVMFQFLGSSTRGYVRTSSLFYWTYDAFGGRSGSLMDSGGGVFMPLVVLGLFWVRRRELLQLELKLWSPGLALVGVGVLLHLLGYMGQQPRISLIGLFTGVYGLMGMAWGGAWLRASFFPFCLLIFSIPLGSLADSLTFRLRVLSCQLAHEASNLLAIDVVREGTELIKPDPYNPARPLYHYNVEAACSGLRSIFAILPLSVVCAFLFFRSWWRRLVMMAAAVPLAVLGNLLRLVTLIVISDQWGQAAGNKFEQGGPMEIYKLLPYVPAFGGLFVLESWMREKRGPVKRKT